MTKKLNFCFLGSSNFSIYVLRNVLKQYKPEIVFTLPAKPKGRGYKLEPNIVYSYALKEKLPVIEIKDFSNFNFNFEFGLLAAFGKIIPKEVIDKFKKGIINVHPSLLPKYRGPNPIREVILNGEKETGVTLFLIDELVDHGPIIAQKKIELKGNENYLELEEKLGILGGKLFNETIEKYLSGEIKPIPQDDSLATYTRKIEKEDGKLTLNDNYLVWDRKIRALNPWPGTYIIINLKGEEKILKIFAIEKINEKNLKDKKIKIGEFFQYKNELGLRLQDAYIVIKELQLQDKKRMSSKEFLNGYKLGTFEIKD
jgi:methionyl-tRNA formyltransferase